MCNPCHNGTRCDTEIPYTFYWKNICSVDTYTVNAKVCMTLWIVSTKLTDSVSLTWLKHNISTKLNLSTKFYTQLFCFNWNNWYVYKALFNWIERYKSWVKLRLSFILFPLSYPKNLKCQSFWNWSTTDTINKIQFGSNGIFES